MVTPGNCCWHGDAEPSRWLPRKTSSKEVAEVINRPRIAQMYGLTEADRAALLRRIDRRGDKAILKRRLPVHVRDPKDEKILATALDGKADYLVTGDEDLLVLNGHQELGPLRIITVTEFLDLVEQDCAATTS